MAGGRDLMNGLMMLLLEAGLLLVMRLLLWRLRGRLLEVVGADTILPAGQAGQKKIFLQGH